MTTDTKVTLPVCLDPEVITAMEKMAEKEPTDLLALIKDLIKIDLMIAEYGK
jgi:hypothetical protein